MAKAEVAETHHGDLATAGDTVKALLGAGEFPQVDSTAISARMLNAMLKAETPEELNAIGGTTPLEELFGVPLEVRDVMARPGTLESENGLAGFVVAAATRLDNGDELIFTTSAYNVAMRLAIAADKGFVPGYRLKVTKSEQATERGFYPYIVENV